MLIRNNISELLKYHFWMKPLKFYREELITNINAVKVSLDFDYVWGNTHQENAKNGISGLLDFESFWRSMLPDPSKSTRLRRFATASVIREVWLQPWSSNIVEYSFVLRGGQTNFSPVNKRKVESIPFNMAAKRVQHVEFNNVERKCWNCWFEALHIST